MTKRRQRRGGRRGSSQETTPEVVPEKKARRPRGAAGWDGAGDAEARGGRLTLIEDVGFEGVVILDKAYIDEGRNDNFVKIHFTVLESNSDYHPPGCSRGQLYSMGLKDNMAFSLAKMLYNATYNTFIDDFPKEEHADMLAELIPTPFDIEEGATKEDCAGYLVKLNTSAYESKSGTELTSYNWSAVSPQDYEDFVDDVTERGGNVDDIIVDLFGLPEADVE